MSKNCKSGRSSKSSQSLERRHLWDPERELPRHLGYKLIPCKYCNRKFFANRIDCHQDICRVKRFQDKRPLFDSVKSRLSGTVAEYFQFPTSENEAGASINPNWRENRQLYLRGAGTLKDDKKRTEAEALSVEAKGRQILALTNSVQCPICGRRFNAEVAARHVPHCTTYVCNASSGSKTLLSARSERTRGVKTKKKN